MPTLQVKKQNEVPAAYRTSRAVREQQLAYEAFIRNVNGDNVGELELDPDEEIRSTKVRLRRAASRIGVNIDTWDADGKVYFKTAEAKRRGRPRKTG